MPEQRRYGHPARAGAHHLHVLTARDLWYRIYGISATIVGLSSPSISRVLTSMDRGRPRKEVVEVFGCPNYDQALGQTALRDGRGGEQADPGAALLKRKALRVWLRKRLNKAVARPSQAVRGWFSYCRYEIKD